MSLIPSLSFLELLAAIPFAVVIAPFVLNSLHALMSNALVLTAMNTISVMLNNTEIVWKPVWNLSLMMSKELMNAVILVTPIVKDATLRLINGTVAFVRTAQSMGVSFASSFPTVMLRLKEIGEALVVIARTLGAVLYYSLRSISLVVGSVERVFLFGKQLLFEAHLLTADDLYNVVLPLGVVMATTMFLYWLRKAPQPQKVSTFQPRRSSRLARKRAMLYGHDLSDALPACKKASAISSNL